MDKINNQEYTNELWLINASITLPTSGGTSYSGRFTSNGFVCTAITVAENGIFYTAESALRVYDYSGWADEGYRYVKISTSQKTSDLYTWLQTNAVKQDKPSAHPRRFILSNGKFIKSSGSFTMQNGTSGDNYDFDDDDTNLYLRNSSFTKQNTGVILN